MDPLKAPPGAAPGEQAQRLIYLRRRYGLTREAFTQYGIPIATLQNWEKVRYTGLNQKGANRLVEAYAAMGIHVSAEWLLYGMGAAPYADGERVEEAMGPLSEEAKIAQELRLFHQLNKDAVDLIVPDEAMLPAFHRGDCVAGRRYFDKEIVKALDHPCILHTASGQVILRLLKRGHKENCYTLIGFDPKTTPITDIPLFSAAPVLWVRRKGLL